MSILRVFFGIFCVGLVLALPADPASAQRGGDEGRGGERDEDRRRDRDRDDDDGRRRGRGRDDDDRRGQSREDRRQWFVRRLDRNGDGRIERSEVDSDRWWGYFERSAKEAGLDPSGGVSVDNYLKARQRQDRQELRAENPTAFLAPLEAQPAPGFDQPLAENELILLNPDKPRPYAPVTAESSEASSSSRSRSSSDDSNRESSSDRTERYANSLMERYDKNGNSILERDEWQDMRGDPERSDLNKDGRITRDELVKRFSSFSRDNNNDEGDRGSRSSRGDERRERTERRSRDGDESESRTTYRFTSALERLPSEARSWIERYDDNKDGQVAMAEFTSSWTDSKVREFFEVDLNRDGVVTAAEYLESKER